MKAPLPRLAAVRLLVVLVMAFGYASTMARGPETAEIGRIFGYEPSLFAVQVLFFLSGYLALRSLARHGSGLRMLASRARRNLPLLALVTGVVAFIVYPLIAEETGMGTLGAADLAAYFLLTVSCADPGQRLPGALDTAHYACLLQGAVWTFRWGAVAYLATALLWTTGLLRRRGIVLAGAVGVTLVYAGVHGMVAKGALPDAGPIEVAARFGYPFALGLAAFAWRDKLPTSRLRRAAWVAAPILFATINFLALPWTPAIEVGTMAGLGLLALFAATSTGPRLSFLADWPQLALPVFLLNWPVAQIWLYLRPELTSWALIALTLGTALALAYGLSKLPFRPPALSQAKSARTA